MEKIKSKTCTWGLNLRPHAQRVFMTAIDNYSYLSLIPAVYELITGKNMWYRTELSNVNYIQDVNTIMSETPPYKKGILKKVNNRV